MITELMQILREFRHSGTGDEIDVKRCADQIMTWAVKWLF